MSDTAKLAVQLTLQGASQFQRELSDAAGATSGFGKEVNTSAFNLANFMSVGTQALGMVQQFAGAAVRFGSALIMPNAELEKFQIMFEHLLGSAGAAQKRIAEMGALSLQMPFDDAELARASKTLEAFGASGMASGQGFEMVADMASFADVQIGQMAQAVGRLYTEIQAGEPIGRAATMFKQMALMSAEDQVALEELQKTGASANEVWAAFIGMMGKTSGAAREMADTFDGSSKIIANTFNEIKQAAGTDLFKDVKADLTELRTLLSENASAADAFSKTFASAYAGVKRALVPGVGGMPGFISGVAERMMRPESKTEAAEPPMYWPEAPAPQRTSFGRPHTAGPLEEYRPGPILSLTDPRVIASMNELIGQMKEAGRAAGELNQNLKEAAGTAASF